MCFCKRSREYKTGWLIILLVTLLAACSDSDDNPSSGNNKPSVPGTPKNLIATPGNNQVTLTWDQVSGATGYRLYWSDFPNAVKTSANMLQNVMPGYRHDNLNNDQAYYYFVTAVNSSGESLPSEQVMAIPGGQLIADIFPDINLRHCVLSHSENDSPYASSVSGELDCSFRGISDITGMEYLTAVTSVNLAGNDIQNINALGNLALLGSINLSNNQLGIDSQSVFESLLQFNELTRVSLSGNPEISCAFLDQLLSQITVTDIEVSEPGTNCTVYSEPPAPSDPLVPTSLRAIPGDQRVTLMWEVVNGASHYNVYWDTVSGVSTESQNVILNVQPPFVHLELNHSGLNNGTNYFYVVTAVVAGNEGQASAEVMALPSADGTLVDGIFSDANLQTCVDEYAASYGWIFIREITGNIDCSSHAIASVQGMEQLLEISGLNLMNNSIADISPLARLTNLTSLYLSNNLLTNIGVLSNLQNLEFLNLRNNDIVDISALANLGALTQLYLNDNQIVDVASLAGLVNLGTLDLRNNNIGGSGIGNINTLVTLTNARSILLAGNTNLSCEELSTLVASVGPNIVDVAGSATTIDCGGVPAEPQDLQAAGGNQRVILTWRSVINADNYHLYWATSPGVDITTATKISNVSSGYQHTGINNGTAYYYVVTAENESGESEASAEVTATPSQVLIAGLFPDQGLQACIDELAAFNNWTTAEQVTGIVNCSARAISEVSGIEHLTAISTLSLNENNISDVTPIGYLTNLSSLSLYRNNITVIDPLAGLTAVRDLFLSRNMIVKVHDLGNLQQLQVLDVRDNQIGTSGAGGVDLLAGLNNATLVNLSGNETISCVELQTLIDALGTAVVDLNTASAGRNCTAPSVVPTGLRVVSGNGQITISWVEVPSATSYNLYWSTSPAVTPQTGAKISVGINQYVHSGLDNDTSYYYVLTSQLPAGESSPSNEITAAPSANGVALSGLFQDNELAECVNAVAGGSGWSYAHEISGTLNCSAQQISDLTGLEYLINLQVLRLGSNNITDISAVATLINLSFLDLFNNAVADISPIANLNNLQTLYLHSNQITDITALADLPILDYLILDDNNISDASAVSGLTSLTRLFFRANALTDISAVAQLSLLSELYLNNNSIIDVGPVANLVLLQQVDLRNNQIGGQGVGNVDTLSSLTNVSKIRLSNNPEMSCDELTTLISVLGPNAIDLGEAQQGVNCQAP